MPRSGQLVMVLSCPFTSQKLGVGAFADHFADWSFSYLDIPALIAATTDIYEYPMVDRPPLAEWTRGRVTLLGDAHIPHTRSALTGRRRRSLMPACWLTAWLRSPSTMH